MYSKIFCFVFVLNYIWSEATLRDVYEELSAGKAPFFEMPCMRIGGICARGFACPAGTSVGKRGLCPDQQKHGMECCRPYNIRLNCRIRKGKCMPASFKCPLNMRILDVTDCKDKEVCCVHEK